MRRSPTRSASSVTPPILATARARTTTPRRIVIRASQCQRVDGSGSAPGPLRYRWTQVAGPWVALDDATAAVTTFRAERGAVLLGVQSLFGFQLIAVYQPLFFDKEGYALLSKTALYYIGGILKHARALLAFCAPTTNSYRRLVPGYEAPINLVYSARNRSACVRIPMYSTSEKAKRLEFRTPDPSCNPYLAFAVMLMAGLDGIQRDLPVPTATEENLYHLDQAGQAKLSTMPGSLGEAITEMAQSDLLGVADIRTGATILEFTKDTVSGMYGTRYSGTLCAPPNADKDFDWRSLKMASSVWRRSTGRRSSRRCRSPGPTRSSPATPTARRASGSRRPLASSSPGSSRSCARRRR